MQRVSRTTEYDGWWYYAIGGTSDQWVISWAPDTEHEYIQHEVGNYLFTNVLSMRLM